MRVVLLLVVLLSTSCYHAGNLPTSKGHDEQYLYIYDRKDDTLLSP